MRWGSGTLVLISESCALLPPAACARTKILRIVDTVHMGGKLLTANLGFLVNVVEEFLDVIPARRHLVKQAAVSHAHHPGQVFVRLVVASFHIPLQKSNM